jgi:hypothetical protein
MSPRMRVRCAFVFLLGLLSFALAGPSAAQVIDLTSAGTEVTDPQGVIWSEGLSGHSLAGTFNTFLRVQRDSVERGFNTDYTPPPEDAKPGSWTHSFKLNTLQTVTIGEGLYYVLRLDADESIGAPEEDLCLDALQIFTASNPSIATYDTLATFGHLWYDMAASQEVHIDTGLQTGGGSSIDMTAFIPTYFLDASGEDYVYVYASLGDCSIEGMHTSAGPEDWSALLGVDNPPIVTAPLAVNGEEGGDLTFSISASDPDGDAISNLTADFSSLPVESDASFTPNGDNTAGTFHWHMNVGDAGDYGVTFTATANDLSTSRTTQIHVGQSGVNIAGVFTWTPRPGDEGVYDIVFTATDEGGTTNFTTTITVITPSGSPAPSAPLAPRAPGGTLAPQAPQKGPIISGTGSITVPTGSTATSTVTASTDLSGTSAHAAAPIRLSARAVRTTTLTVDTAELPPENDATFVVDNQPVISGTFAVTVPPGVPVSQTYTAADPEGDAIEHFTADLSVFPSGNPGSFSANGTNTSGTLSWTPRLADVGTYVVHLEATNQLVGPADVTIIVTAAAPVRLFVKEPIKLNIGAARATNCVYIEPVDGSIALTDVNVSTVRMVSPGTGSVTEIGPVPGKPSLIQDRDNNHIQDLQVCFLKSDLRMLFSLLSERAVVTVHIQGQLVSGAYFDGTLDVEVISNGPKIGQVSIAPNPLNPQAKLSLNLGKGGFLRVTLFDMQGRLVRELVNEQNVAPGPREILVDGLDSRGKALSSGVYFFRVESADGVHNGRLAIVR